MKYFLFAAFASLHLAVSAQSQSGFWRDETGKPVAETESMMSRNGFGGALLVTTDEDWERKWNTPPETRPSFTKAEVVPYGKKIFILTFFSNPKLDSSGTANVRCDYKVLSPTGNATFDQKDMSCFVGRIGGGLYNMYLSAPVITFSGDSSDLPGTWVVEVVLRNGVGGTELPLRGTFALK